MYSDSVMLDPLIPVLFADGHEGMCSIRDIFARAHEMLDVKAYSDQARVAILRLLLAIVMDSHNLVTGDDRADLLSVGRFDVSILDDYIAECERAEPRFRLFDAAHPFMQCAFDPQIDGKAAEKAAATLIPEFATGNNHMFFMHRSEGEYALTPAEALQGLLVAYLFSTAGVQDYPSSVNNAPPLYALIEGKTLFQTLVINSLSEKECTRQGIPYGRGEVPWRTDEVVVPKRLFQNVSLLQALTWRPRRITLKRNPESGLVNGVYFQQGHNFIGNDLWRDPHVPRVEYKDGRYGNLLPQLGRALWRDAGTLVNYEGESRPPAICAYMDLVGARSHAAFDLSLTGFVTSNASILGATCERLSMPVGLFRNTACAHRFVRDLAFCEAAQAILVNAVSSIMKPDKTKRKNSRSVKDESASKNTKRPVELARQAQVIFLKRAHDFLFGAYLAEIMRIGADEDPEDRLFALLKRLDEEVGAGLRTALDVVVNRSGSSAAALERHAAIERIVIGWYNNRKKEREGE